MNNACQHKQPKIDENHSIWLMIFLPYNTAIKRMLEIDFS
jgi:hypothetical protein